MNPKTQELRPGETTQEETMRHGTAWTDPGQGATVGELGIALNYVPSTPQRDQARYSFEKFESYSVRTNLRLTGAPLNAYDIRCIAEAR